jgi:hypothetical protein
MPPGFLALKIVEAIVDGRHPQELTAIALTMRINRRISSLSSSTSTLSGLMSDRRLRWSDTKNLSRTRVARLARAARLNK